MDDRYFESDDAVDDATVDDRFALTALGERYLDGERGRGARFAGFGPCLCVA